MIKPSFETQTCKLTVDAGAGAAVVSGLTPIAREPLWAHTQVIILVDDTSTTITASTRWHEELAVPTSEPGWTRACVTMLCGALYIRRES